MTVTAETTSGSTDTRANTGATVAISAEVRADRLTSAGQA